MPDPTDKLGPAFVQTGTPATTPARADPRVGTRLGKYQIFSRIGAGGMGHVYLAEDTVLKRPVALKLLPPAVANDENAVRRLLLEAQAAARLVHPNVVCVYEADYRDETCFIAMEFVRGKSAGAVLHERGPYAWAEATQIVAGACRGLQAAHAVGLIHRDIKPSNIMCGADGSVKLADFGLAKAIDQSTPSLTAPNHVVGTADFMSPEQCRAERLDERSDIYSLGATYFTLLTGRPPYKAETPMQVMFAHCSNPVPDPRVLKPDIPEGCAAIVRRAMAKERFDRYPNVTALLEALAAVQWTLPPTTPLGSQGISNIAELSPTAASLPAGSGSQTAPVVAKRRRPRWPVAVAVAAIVLASGSWLLIAGRNGAPSSIRDGSSKKTSAAGTQRPFRDLFSKDGYPLPMGGKVEIVAFSPDGKLFAVGLMDQAAGARIWRMDGDAEPTSVWQDGICSIAFSADSKTLAGCSAKAVRLWDVAGGKESVLKVAEGGRPRTLAFSPDGKHLTAGININDDAQAVVMLWELPGYRERPVLPGHTGRFWALAFSADGKELVSGGEDGVVRFWDVASGKSWRPALPIGSKIYGLALTDGSPTFTPPGKWLGIASGAGLKFFRQMDWENPYGNVLEGAMRCVIYSPDGRYWAAVNSEGRLSVRRNRPPARAESARAHAGEASGIAFSPDGKYLATGGHDGKVRLWNADQMHGD